MLKVRNLIKIILLITMTVLVQLEVIREKGRWVAGISNTAGCTSLVELVF